MLEGADQPPFFPAIETARIRIDQVERLTNGAPQAAIAQFDGWYLKNGFEADRISNDRDSLEIYLDIVNCVTMDMGSSGDRSGGIMRPAGQVIALSRQRGPLTGPNAAVPSAGRTGSVTGGSGYPISPPESGDTQRLVGGEKRERQGRRDDARRAFEQFFTATDALDTKILGLVSLKELVKYLNISDAASDLPRLRDAVEYGLGGVETGAAIIRTQVIVPLNDVVKGLDEQWRKAGAQAKGSLPSIVGGMEPTALLPLFSQALSEYLALLVGPRLARLPPLSDVKGLARKVLDPVKDIAESGMLKIADPQKPGNPNPTPLVGDNFSIPSIPRWQVPGSNSSLVAHIHKVAEAVEAVLQKARQSDKKEDVVDDASRVKLAMLGHHALEAENQLHRATIALRLTGTVLQRLVSEQVMAWVSSLAAPSQVATKLLLDAFRPIVQQVADAYKTFLDTRKTAYRATLGTPAEWVNDALLVAADPSLAFLPDKAPDKSETKAKDESDQLYLDSESLRSLREIKGEMSAVERSQAVRFLDHFVTGWRTGQSTPLSIAKQVQRISLEEIRSKLMALIDFSAIREEIEERIKLLIPTAATLSYDFSTTIQSTAGSGKVFQPKEGCLLSVKSHARINLLDAKKGPTFQSIGELGAFDIRLLGNVDALTLHFKGVRFMSRGGTPDCDLQYDGFTIGNELRFLEQLTPFFGSKAGSGFYLQPLSSGIGLEAGYGLNLGTFSVGNLAIFNVSLNAAARLPFDNREATFVAALSRRDSPFTIAVAPYGGSGFFALEANTTGIVGFEASFEYGGAAAFKYGPLEGQGRLMVGAYIRSGKGEPKIFATFYVGGSASIWIFSFGASLYVNATQDKHSRNMVGSATYAFSFSMGFVDFDYRVNVDVDLPLDGSKKEEKKDERSAHSQGLDSDEPVRLAAISPEAWGSTVRDVPLHLASFQQSQQASTRPKGTSSNGKPKRRVKTVCPSADWREYSRYFDMSLKVRLEEY